MLNEDSKTETEKKKAWAGELKKADKDFADLRDETISNLIVVYQRDTGERFDLDNFIDWFKDSGTFGNFIFDFSDGLSTKAIIELGKKDKRFIDAVRKIAYDYHYIDKDGNRTVGDPGYNLGDNKATDDELIRDLVDLGTSTAESIDIIHEYYNKLNEDLIMIDPFDTEFPQDISEEEIRLTNLENGMLPAADFLQELARELGIEDQVEIKPAEDHCENCEDEIDSVSEIEPELPPEIDSVSEEQVAVEAPCEGEECDPHLEDEDVCPVCGRQGCKCGPDCKCGKEDHCCEDPVKVDDQGFEEPAKEISKCHVCPECGKEICEDLESEINQVANQWTESLEEAAPGDAEYEVNAKIDLTDVEADRLEQERVQQNELEEATHPKEAQPNVDMEKLADDNAKLAALHGKPVIYGYMGNNHHGQKRYFEFEDPIICDDLEAETEKVIAKYHPAGSVLVAYPNQLYENKVLSDFVQREMKDGKSAEEVAETDEFKKLAQAEGKKDLIEISDELNDEFDDEMSDVEFAEKLYDAYKEKHDGQKLEEDSDEFDLF